MKVAAAEAHLEAMLRDRQAFARADHGISTAGNVAESAANILALVDDQAFFGPSAAPASRGTICLKAAKYSRCSQSLTCASWRAISARFKAP